MKNDLIMYASQNEYIDKLRGLTYSYFAEKCIKPKYLASRVSRGLLCIYRHKLDKNSK